MVGHSCAGCTEWKRARSHTVPGMCGPPLVFLLAASPRMHVQEMHVQEARTYTGAMGGATIDFEQSKLAKSRE